MQSLFPGSLGRPRCGTGSTPDLKPAQAPRPAGCPPGHGQSSTMRPDCLGSHAPPTRVSSTRLGGLQLPGAHCFLFRLARLVRRSVSFLRLSIPRSQTDEFYFTSLPHDPEGPAAIQRGPCPSLNDPHLQRLSTFLYLAGILGPGQSPLLG